MSGDLYQQAKAAFAELLELSEDKRDVKLSELGARSPDLEREVRSLLDYHTAQSLIAPPATPKIRTRSTLSTTYHTSRSLKWLRGPLRGLLIAGPLFFLSLLFAYWIDGVARRQLSASVTHQLSAAIDSRLSELRIWEKQELAEAVYWGKNSKIVEPIEQLVESIRALSPEDPQLRDKLKQAGCCHELSEQLSKLAGRPVKFAVWDRRMIELVDSEQETKPGLLGNSTTTAGANMLAAVLKGTPKLFLPHASLPITEGTQLDATQAGNISILVPVRSSEGGAVLAALMLGGYGLDEQYQAMLKRWNADSQGEIYLISQRGALLTPSRYATQIDELPLARDKSNRLLPNQLQAEQPQAEPTAQPILVRDPGTNLLSGIRPDQASATWSPTLLARQVISGDNGSFVDGYRNYVGEKVVGAWRWLPDHDAGIALEENYDQTFALARTLRNALLALAGMFSIALVGFTLAVAWGERSRRLKSISEVGPYQIQELLGEGGMGRVYLAEHALLCRQSAIKVLTKGDNDLSVISRFEREVQLASQLTHPNTISIYDFGRSREGVFYYAMEYIHGAHLGQLIEYTGPVEPGRTIYILRQLCRALSEAHQAGVVHRDVKPQNIMVCNRGGEPDFVKLFDYGLVKAFAPGVSQNPSQTRVVVGTPRFMAPERLNSPWLADPRVDIYSVGALAYYLLTAQLPPLVTIGDASESEQPGVETLDLPADVVDFGGILSVCMSVEPASRPSSMTSLLRELDSLAKKFPWTVVDSELWWSKHEEKLLKLVRAKRKQLPVDGDKLWRRARK